MKIFSGKKDKKGFTTMEIIIVVAILMIAMAIVAPGLVRLSRDLKIAKLDDIAREIYTSAQSRTISLSVGGQLAQVAGVSDEAQTASDNPAAPATAIKYVYKSGAGTSDGTDLILPLGSIEEVVRQNYYIIEYNPATAMINGVYYWENEENDFLPSGYGSIDPNDRVARMTYSGGMVGYYNGDDVERDETYTSSVAAELVNDEELYLTIMQGIDQGRVLKGTITVTLTDLDKGVSREAASFDNSSCTGNLNLSFEETKAKSEGGGGIIYAPHYKLTLDSLKSELRFSTLYPENAADGSFHPGCNLKVTVSFQEEGKQVQEESFLTNSLFASVEGKYNSSRTAYISCGRHLENLGVLWVYHNRAATGKLEDMSDKLNGVEKAVQTKNIDWHKSLEALGGDAVISRPSFKPIVNGNLKEFDGGGNTISHVDIFGKVQEELLKGYQGSGKFGIGLFGQFDGNKLVDINLVDFTLGDLTGSSSMYVGLLAGMMNNTGEACEVSGCHAYATVDRKTGKSPECSINVPENTDSVGGLFGSIENSKMTMNKCFASLTEIAGNARYAGGLAGRIDSSGGRVAISECYADTGVWSPAGSRWRSGISGQQVGGLLGCMEGSSSFTMENSYAVGCVSGSQASSDAYGLVGDGNDSGPRILQKCYAALLEEDDIVEALVPKDFADEEKIKTCINYNGKYDDFDSLTTAGGRYFKGTIEQRARTTHAYGMLNTGADGKPTDEPEDESQVFSPAYPFPRLSDMPHYGDWPQEGVFTVQMAYFEVYSDNSIGFYNSTIFDTLKDDENCTVVRDGYAIVFPVKDGKYNGIVMKDEMLTETDPKLSVRYNGGEVDEEQLKLMDAEKKFGKSLASRIGIDPDQGITITTVRGAENSYYPLFLSDAMMVEGAEDAGQNGEGSQEKNRLARHDSYYQKLEAEVKGEVALSVYFNPYVAKSEFQPAAQSQDPPGTPAVSILRTPRQIRAYAFEAMQKTAIGAGDVAHTLRLERNIALTGEIETDSTITGEMACRDLSIPGGIRNSDGTLASDANVILELNGKTLTGTGGGSVVSSWGGRLAVYGAKKPEEGASETPGGSTMGTITGGSGTKKDEGTDTSYGGGIYVKGGDFSMTGGILTGNHAAEGGGIYMEADAEGTLKNVTIQSNTATDQSSVNIHVGRGVTLEGCRIIDNN